MRRIAAACAAIMIFASPAGAQSQADQPASSQVPAAPALPPNFVPPPPARLYDNYPRRSHHGATRHRTTQHHATQHRATEHRATQHRATRHHEDTERHGTAKHRRKAHDRGTTEHQRRSHEHQQPVHASKRTIRQCHGMSYREIMRHSTCRALIRQDLEAADRAHSQASKRHTKSAAHHRSSKDDRSKAHHRSPKDDRAKAHRRSSKHHR